MRRLIGLSLALTLVMSALVAAPVAAAKGLNERQSTQGQLHVCGQNIPGDFILHVLETATFDGSGGYHQKDKVDTKFQSEDGEVRMHVVFNKTTNLTAGGDVKTITSTETTKVFGLDRKPISARVVFHITFNAKGEPTSAVSRIVEDDCPV